jgi:hypothetical protein
MFRDEEKSYKLNGLLAFDKFNHEIDWSNRESNFLKSDLNEFLKIRDKQAIFAVFIWKTKKCNVNIIQLQFYRTGGPRYLLFLKSRF